MATVTVSEKEYRVIKSKAALYDRMVWPISRTRNMFPTEEYSRSEIKELAKADKLPKKTVARLTKILQSI